MSNPDKVNIYNLEIDSIDYSDLEAQISGSVSGNKKLLITYANANTINYICSNPQLIPKLNSFDIIHPDGIGIYLASKILYGKNGIKKRFNGSDFYPALAELAVKNKWRVFFLGHHQSTLDRIKLHYPELIIAGLQEGYNFNDEDVVKLIGNTNPDILIVGLGHKKQDEWIFKYTERYNCKVCISVGDGIKVFAGTKIRGPKILRALGMEWFIRFLTNPVKYFKRYIIGNPLFLYRIIILKIRNFR